MRPAPAEDVAFDFVEERPAYRVDDRPLAALGDRSLRVGACDLLDVVEAVGTADRLARRPPASLAGNAWSRQLSVVIGVSDQDRWMSVSDRLGELLGWLTDDDWSLRFERRKLPLRAAKAALQLFRHQEETDAVALFSGGLDSLCGAVQDLSVGRSLLLLSLASNARLTASQRGIAMLMRCLGRVRRTEILAQLHGLPSIENSQRTRGFAFLGIGAIAACAAGAKQLRVYENGVGSINLAMSPAQVGAHMSKAMHPKTLALAAAVFSEVLGESVSITNPNAYRTKAEMCVDLRADAHRLVPLALSCDTAYTHRLSGVPSCGECTSCILRRQALLAAGLDELDAKTRHRVDAFKSGSDDRVLALRIMLFQVAQLERRLRSSNPWVGLCAEFPGLYSLDGMPAQGLFPTPENPAIRRDLIVEMYRRYVGEWSRVLPEGLSRYMGSTVGAQAA